ncbi:MAG: CPBP family intramembrane metalloprotease [Treponema sp.]|nr:CPBP family intramembrane metalloprotease [Treponema sp.]
MEKQELQPEPPGGNLEAIEGTHVKNTVYPKIKNAITLCLLFLALNLGSSLLIFAFLHLSGLSQDSLTGEIALMFAAVICFGTVILIGYKKTKRKFNEVFKFNAVSPFLWVTVTILTIGLIIVLSALGNLLNLVLPMPEWLIQIFESMMVEQPLVISILNVGVLAAFTEELFFRGLILDGLNKNYSKRKAIIVSALLFGLIHLNPWQFLSAFIIGLFLAWICIETGSIWLCIFIHFLNNTLITVLSRYSASIPIQGFNSDYSAPVEFEPWWFTLFGALMLALGMAMLIREFRKAKAPVQAGPLP